MLRRDLAADGITYWVEGPDSPLFADFHALRHSYITALGRAGVDLRTAQELAGHSPPILTARYSHRWADDLHEGVERLPGFLPPGKATPLQFACRAGAGRIRGTDPVTVPDPVHLVPDIPPADAVRHRLAANLRQRLRQDWRQVPSRKLRVHEGQIPLPVQNQEKAVGDPDFGGIWADDHVDPMVPLPQKVNLYLADAVRVPQGG
jgi:hypothetical protein